MYERSYLPKLICLPSGIDMFGAKHKNNKIIEQQLGIEDMYVRFDMVLPFL